MGIHYELGAFLSHFPLVFDGVDCGGGMDFPAEGTPGL